MSRLFDLNSVSGDVANVEIDSFAISEKLVRQEVIIGNRQKKTIEDVLPARFEPGVLYSCLSSGLWDQYQLVDYILNQTGEGSSVHLATWSISELSARKLVDWLETGRVSIVKGVLDFRSKNHHPAAFHLAKNVFSEIKIDYCHAKVTVICSPQAAKNPDYITVIGSANWTQNPRKEACTIFNSKKTSQVHVDWIEHIIKYGDYGLDG